MRCHHIVILYYSKDELSLKQFSTVIVENRNCNVYVFILSQWLLLIELK